MRYSLYSHEILLYSHEIRNFFPILLAWGVEWLFYSYSWFLMIPLFGLLQKNVVITLFCNKVYLTRWARPNQASEHYSPPLLSTPKADNSFLGFRCLSRRIFEHLFSFIRTSQGVVLTPHLVTLAACSMAIPSSDNPESRCLRRNRMGVGDSSKRECCSISRKSPCSVQKKNLNHYR